MVFNTSQHTVMRKGMCLYEQYYSVFIMSQHTVVRKGMCLYDQYYGVFIMSQHTVMRKGKRKEKDVSQYTVIRKRKGQGCVYVSRHSIHLCFISRYKTHYKNTL
jgi:hypothetical protein